MCPINIQFYYPFAFFVQIVERSGWIDLRIIGLEMVLCCGSSGNFVIICCDIGYNAFFLFKLFTDLRIIQCLMYKTELTICYNARNTCCINTKYYPTLQVL